MKYLNEVIDDNFIEYANYVVKDRALPNLVDGLKPVQRRILHSMEDMDDGRFNKVANIVGHTMKYHPHGDASIYEALVNIANKELFIEKQGNFGNILTGDRAAAGRYIEARLTPLAKEVLYEKEITEYHDSYDGRNKEPLVFPAKIPLLLLFGVEGIAVGMSTKILPHNFKEVLEAEIACLKEEEFELYPDFQQGGLIDITEYNKGNGKIRVRAKLDAISDKKIIIREIPYGTTTESIIASIEKATKKGKLKIASINDYTTSEIEIEVNLARGYTTQDVEAALYAFTDCEVSISTQLLCIHNALPVQMSIPRVVEFHANMLRENLKKLLELKLERLKEKKLFKQLSQIFIENRLYKQIEEVNDYDLILNTVKDAFDNYKEELYREVTLDDSERLLQLQIKRISRFDIEKNRKELLEIDAEIQVTIKNLGRITAYTIDYLNDLIKKYAGDFERKTVIENIETVTMAEAAIENLKLSLDRSNGYLGTAVKSDESIMVSEFSKILIIYSSGVMKVVKVEEKVFIGKGVLFFDKVDTEEASSRIFSVIYRDKKSKLCFVKRFANSSIKYILDKEYRYLPENSKVEYFTTRRNLHFTCYLERLPRMRSFYHLFELEDVRIKGYTAGGNRLSTKNVIKIKARKSEVYLDGSEYVEEEVKKKNQSTDTTFVNPEDPEKIIPDEPQLFAEDE